MVAYTLRTSAFKTETTYSVTRESLVVQTANGVRQDIPLSEVESVELEYHGESGGVSRFACVITAASQKFTVSNTHYVGLGRRESRNATYRQFVLMLHDSLRQHGDTVRFATVNRDSSLQALAAAVLMPLLSAVAMSAMAYTESMKASLGAGSLALCHTSLASPAALRRGRYTTDEIPHLFLP